MSFKELPVDISRKQKDDLLNQKVIEFEEFMDEIQEKYQ
jgi:hypothetical protein